MKIFDGIPGEGWIKDNSALVLGNFDGIHLGHQKLIEICKEKAFANGWKVTVITFKPHPQKFFFPERSLKFITSLAQKEEILSRLGVDRLVYLPFTAEIAKMKPQRFVKNILSKFQPKLVVIGFNYRFGFQGSGDGEMLKILGKNSGFEVAVADAVKIDGDIVSSSLIRQAIQEGNVNKAAKFLGRFPEVKGKVVHGDGRGRTFGIPTANVELPEEILIPAVGVYAGYVHLQEKSYKSVINIGYKPTFGQGLPKTVEAFILNFSQDLYEQQLKISFVDRIRDEKVFNSSDKLLEQIDRDITTALNLL